MTTTPLTVPPLATSGPSALLAGGKSGGHVFPALAIGEELEARGWGLGFVGTAEGMEARLARERGLRFFEVAARPVVGRGGWGRIRALALLLRSSLRARRLVAALEPSVVVGTGGFVSVPATLGAWLARRPVVIVEPNVTAGAANRLLSRIARAAAVAFEQTARQLACPTWTTGVPVRRAFFEQGESPPADGPLRLLVLGGSQGARSLNLAVPGALAAWQQRSGAASRLVVLHQCGAGRVEETNESYRRAFGVEPEALAGRGLEIAVTPFLDDVAAELGQSHLVISRAGAITVAELCAAGRAAILVPLALAGGHQRDNARALEQAGAARRIDDDRLGEELESALEELLASPETVAEMGRRARSLARRDASRSIADRLEALVAGRVAA